MRPAQRSKPGLPQLAAARRFPAALAVAVLCLAMSAVCDEKAFDLFPVSKPWRDVRIPRYDDHDVLTSMMHTEALTRQDDQELKLEGLTLVMFQASGEISLRLKTKQGLYDVGASMLKTHSTTYIDHEQFTMQGDRLTFDTAKQQGTLVGNVEMLIYGIPLESPSPAAPPAQPDAPPAEEKVQPEIRAAEQTVEVAQLNPSRVPSPQLLSPSNLHQPD